jgi:hypothetical protein
MLDTLAAKLLRQMPGDRGGGLNRVHDQQARACDVFDKPR